MIVIKLVRHAHDANRIDTDQIPEAIINATMAQRARPHLVLDDTEYRPFDRLFERENKCRIEYSDPAWGSIDCIIWDDERDYTMFLLKWTSS